MRLVYALVSAIVVTMLACAVAGCTRASVDHRPINLLPPEYRLDPASLATKGT
jgi:hypothetical protein